MREDVFIRTRNYQVMQGMIQDMRKTRMGLEMGAVIGSTGRGKSAASERIVTEDESVALVRYQTRLTPIGLIREIAFMLGGERPRATDRCFEVIREELAYRRRVIVVDESDRMTLKHLETLRDLHDVLKVPVVLVGEESLGVLLERERRIKRRVAHRMHFEPVTSTEVAAFYQEAMGHNLTGKQAAALSRHAEGDFRMVVNDAIQIEKIMSASDLNLITDDLVREVCHENGG
jgi:DNA transposition AAA+ family ATPase